MDILNSKQIITDEINKILKSYNENISNHQNEITKLSDEMDRLIIYNKKLLHEVSEKDKLLSQKDKTIFDYELMIQNLQTNNKKELDNKEKFDIIRNQDKLINDQNKEIKKLKDNLLLLNHSNISIDIKENKEDKKDKDHKGKEDNEEWLRMINLNLMSSVNIVNSLKKHSTASTLSIICI